MHIQCSASYLGALAPSALHEITAITIKPRERLILIFTEVCADQEHRDSEKPLETREYRTMGAQADPYIAQYLPVGYANLLGRPEFEGANFVTGQNSEEQN